MADETNIKQTEASANKIADAVNAPAKAAAATVTKAARTEKAAKAPRKARATATKRRARQTTAKVVKAAKTVNRRAAKSATRTMNQAATAAAAPLERIQTMTYDFNQLFAGFQIPGADRFQSMFAGTGDRAQDFAAKGQQTAAQMTDLAKANVEAIVEAGKIAVAGVKSIGQDALASGREGLDMVSRNARSLNEATSPAEFMQIQSELAKSAFDRMVAENSKLVERMVKLAGEAAQPIQNRASLNAERVNELMA